MEEPVMAQKMKGRRGCFIRSVGEMLRPLYVGVSRRPHTSASNARLTVVRARGSERVEETPCGLSGEDGVIDVQHLRRFASRQRVQRFFKCLRGYHLLSHGIELCIRGAADSNLDHFGQRPKTQRELL
jgi:hypothetical protein